MNDYKTIYLFSKEMIFWTRIAMKTDNTKAMNDEMMRYVPLPDVINMTFKPNNAVKNKVAKIESTSNNV